MLKLLVIKFKRILKWYKQANCEHFTSDNYIGSSSTGKNIYDNYCCYHCMSCGKIIKFLGRSNIHTTIDNVTTLTPTS